MISLFNVNKIYNKGKANEFQALYDLSLNIKDGELVGIVGKSGSGKTTLLNIIGCIDTYTSGNYILDDISVSKCTDKNFAEIRNSKIGIVKINIQKVLQQLFAADMIKVHWILTGEVRYRPQKRVDNTRYRYITFFKKPLLSKLYREALDIE